MFFEANFAFEHFVQVGLCKNSLQFHTQRRPAWSAGSIGKQGNVG
jgi:hypothetical protein